jgi:AcrR family transcriptional regulator
MKREEKNQQMKRRIMDSALQEFSRNGYGASSVNNIASIDGISKGIIYHYFSSKDELFLACVEECFDALTEFLRNKARAYQGDMANSLESYFSARMDFFATHPIYQRIFCESIMMPPQHLANAIQKKKHEFDALNILILEKLLQTLPLRQEISPEEVIETFREFQDFINAKYRFNELSADEFKAHERQCQRALNILLYGVVERK